MLKLYHLQSCPYCVRVQSKLDELQVECVKVDVPWFKPERKELIDISGQPGVPTLVCDDGTIIADDDDKIIAYLEENFGKVTDRQS